MFYEVPFLFIIKKKKNILPNRIIFIRIWFFKRHVHSYAGGDTSRDTRETQGQEHHWRKKKKTLKKVKITIQTRAGAKSAPPP